MSKTTKELFTIEQLAEAMGAECHPIHDSPTLTRSARLKGTGWEIFAEIEYNAMDKIRLLVIGKHTTFGRYVEAVEDEGSGVRECRVGRGRDVERAAAEVWRKLGMSAQATDQKFQQEQAKDSSYKEAIDQIFDLMKTAMPEAAEPYAGSEPRLRWSGGKHDYLFELRKRRHRTRDIMFEFLPDFNFCEGGAVSMSVPAFTPIVSLVEAQGWLITNIKAMFNMGGDIKIRLNKGEEVEMVKILLEGWLTYLPAETA